MFQIEECILYRNFEEGALLKKMSSAYQLYLEERDTAADKIKSLFYQCLGTLASMADAYGFSGNLWHNYLTHLLVNHENAFSTACEISGKAEGTVCRLALHDFTLFQELFHFDLPALEAFCTGQAEESLLCAYESGSGKSKQYSERIQERLGALGRQLAAASSPEEFMEALTAFYQEFGVGKLGLHKAFRLEHKSGADKAEIVPIHRIAHVRLDDLVGYEIAKKKLIDNTEAFLSGKRANNCLLYGDAGTGKSSSIKAILNQYYEKGLRIIEVYKHQFQDLNDAIAQIKNRHYKFILYMDDLSFEDFEIEYKYLKAVIEGGLEKKPDNVLIYATSNRRHLVRERYSDKADRDDDLHTNDTVQEKLSLVARFGVTIYFGAPDKKEFQEIVTTLARRSGVTLSEEELLYQANIWELNHGGLSGRTAQQFIDYLLGQQ